MNGEPFPVSGIGTDGRSRFAPRLALEGGALAGTLEADAEIAVADLRGHILDSFRAPAGRFSRALPPEAQGILVARVKNARGESVSMRLGRVR